MSDFQPGQLVKVISGGFPQGPVFHQRGDEFELTEEDCERSDIAQHVADAEEYEDEEDTEEEAVSSDLAQMEKALNSRTVVQARSYLDQDGWTLDGMKLAREAELNGKNRETLLDYIDSRILDLEEGT